MRTLKLYLHGSTMGTPPGSPPKTPSKRSEVNGWSQAATRRNIAFLRSVEPSALNSCPLGTPAAGFAVTLTLRDCPPSSADWRNLINAYIRRIRRRGLIRCHWVTEWQRRGVPHLHLAVWIPDTDDSYPFEALVLPWLKLASPYGVSPRSQYLAPISDALGWFQYVAKHAARGVKHYQRSSDNIPSGWLKTGRVWGKIGDWVTADPHQLSISDDVFYRLRRLVRSWRLADARSSGDGYRIRLARTMLASPNRSISEIRGVSEWVPLASMLTLLDVARGSGVVEYR